MTTKSKYENLQRNAKQWSSKPLFNQLVTVDNLLKSPLIHHWIDFFDVFAFFSIDIGLDLNELLHVQ